MRISFGENTYTKPRVRLKMMQGRAVKVADLTDEQVSKTNQTRKLPDGYHLVYSLDGYGARNVMNRYQMTVTKGLPKIHPLQEAFYFDTLQNGYELENYKGKTYLREAGTTVKELKSKMNFNIVLYAVLTLLISGILYKKSLKK